VLLREYEHQKTQLEEKVLINLNELTRPHLARLGEGKLTPRQRQLLEAAVGSLDMITSPLNRRFVLEGSRLTPTEAQVAGLIRQGKTTKEIAEAMGVTIRTVEDHRQNIRKRLHLTKKKINLQAYLQSLS
jgi:DNA-binding CsgD family transcriptional regulator